MLLLIHNDNKRRSSDVYFSGETRRKVQDIRKRLSANIDEEITIEELSKQAGINRTTMQKVFKEMYGVTVSEYRRQVRIQEAKNLLLSTEYTISDIAVMCGYNNASKFARIFKLSTGISPSEWRKR